jgi:WD40 repeat protein
MQVSRVWVTVCRMAVAVAAVAIVQSASQFQASAGPHADREQPSNPPDGQVAKRSLPPRALLRIGRDDLRLQSFVNTIAFSPDGRHVAAAGPNTPSPRVVIFDIRTGRQVKQLIAPGNQEGWVESVAYSPDGTKLLWGESSGVVALWGLVGDRLLFREKLHGGSVSTVAYSPDGRSPAWPAM